MYAKAIYSKSTQGDINLSPNFKIKEFACNDGSDEIIFDNNLIPLIQRFRDYVEAPVEINSAYRTPSYNAEVGGAPNSYHIYGRALDVQHSDNHQYLTSPYMMASFFNTLGVKGIIQYDWGVHFDTREYPYIDPDAGRVNIPYRGVCLKKGMRVNGEGVTPNMAIDLGCAQYKLWSLGFLNDNADMIFGDHTENAVMAFQRKAGLDVDRTYRILHMDYII